MTSPDDAVTVGQLREFLEEYEDDTPIAVAASGAHDFLSSSGLGHAHFKRTRDGMTVYLDGDKQV